MNSMDETNTMSTEERLPKRPRLSDEVNTALPPSENEDQIVVAGPSNSLESSDLATPEIFNLTIDCFDEIFEYLEVKDLYSISLTCKKLQRISGEYFHRNFPAAVKYFKHTKNICLHSHRRNERMKIPGFSQFVKHLEYHGGFSQIRIAGLMFRWSQMHAPERSDKFKSLNLIETQIDSSRINRITFVETNFHNISARHIKNILGKVEEVDFKKCYYSGNAYDKLLKYCTNLKRLNINYSHLVNDENEDVDQVTTHRYPLLEHFKLIPSDSVAVKGLNDFIDGHPNLRTFSTSSQRLFQFRDELFKCTSKLDVLKVIDDRRTTDFGAICDVIKKLHVQGFYKRLHFEGNGDEECCIGLASLPAVEKLCVKRLIQTYRLPAMVNLKHLAILKDANPNDMDTLAMCLHELQRVFLFKATMHDILPFIRRSKNLTKIKVYPKDEASFENGILDLSMLETERAKLNGARKVMVYVPDGMFLKTKWAIKDGNINLNLVEIQRYDLYSWGMSD